MNKGIYKEQQRRLIGRALSLIYGQTRRKDLAFVYRVRPAYFRYFDKQHLRQVWKQIRKNSFNEKYRPDVQTFIISCMAMILLRKRKRIELVCLKDFQLLLG